MKAVATAVTTSTVNARVKATRSGVCEIVIVDVFVLCGIGGQDVSSGHYPRCIAITAVEDKQYYRARKC